MDMKSAKIKFCFLYIYIAGLAAKTVKAPTLRCNLCYSYKTTGIKCFAISYNLPLNIVLIYRLQAKFLFSILSELSLNLFIEAGISD